MTVHFQDATPTGGSRHLNQRQSSDKQGVEERDTDGFADQLQQTFREKLDASQDPQSSHATVVGSLTTANERAVATDVDSRPLQVAARKEDRSVSELSDVSTQASGAVTTPPPAGDQTTTLTHRSNLESGVPHPATATVGAMPGNLRGPSAPTEQAPLRDGGERADDPAMQQKGVQGNRDDAVHTVGQNDAPRKGSTESRSPDFIPSDALRSLSQIVRGSRVETATIGAVPQAEPENRHGLKQHGVRPVIEDPRRPVGGLDPVSIKVDGNVRSAVAVSPMTDAAREAYDVSMEKLQGLSQAAVVARETHVLLPAASAITSQISQAVLGDLVDARPSAPNVPSQGEVITAPNPTSVLRSIKLQLQPAELGLITVKISLTENTLQLDLQADDPATAKSIGQNRDALSSVLQGRGYIVDEIVVRTIEIGRGNDAPLQSERFGSDASGKGMQGDGQRASENNGRSSRGNDGYQWSSSDGIADEPTQGQLAPNTDRAVYL